MTLSFDAFRVVEVKNPSKHCVEIHFSDTFATMTKKTFLVIFEQQVKYVITEEHEDYRRVKMFIRDDKDPIVIDFHAEEYQMYEAFFMALYNKTI